MALSLEELWRNSRDEEIVKAVNDWPTINEKAQRAIRAEVERRGLKIAVPDAAATSADASRTEPNPFTPTTLLIVVGVLAFIIALGILLN